MTSFENLYFEKSKSKRMEKHNAGYKGIFRMSPSVKCDEFEFSFKGKYDSDKKFRGCIGVVDKNHPILNPGGNLVGQAGIGWGLCNGTGHIFYPLVPSKTKAKKDALVVSQRCKEDQFGFRISKIKKTVELISKDGQSKGTIFENCVFPDELFLAASLDCGSSSCNIGSWMELVEFKRLSPIFISEEQKELTERLEYVQDKYSTFKIPLQNKTLELCKPFLFPSSTIKNLHKMETYNGLSDIALNVDDAVITKILIGFDIDYLELEKPEEFFDYFRFFKLLGLERKMLEVIKKVSTMITNFKKGFMLFSHCVNISETDEVKSWFSSSPQMVDRFSFLNSFTLCVFNKMKSFESELSISSPLMFIPHLSVVAYHIKKYTIQDIASHSDFKNMEKTDLESVENVFSHLYHEENMKNLLLITVDDHKFPVHREVLILKSNFFYKMFSFGGRETHELETSSTVQLRDLKLKEIEILVRYFYMDDVVSSDLDSLILCMVHCDKYFETQMLSKLLITFEETQESVTEAEVVKCLDRVGYLLGSEELKKRISSIIIRTRGKLISDERIEKILKRSEKNRLLNQVLEENKKMREENKRMKEEMSNLKEKISSMEERMKKLEESIN